MNETASVGAARPAWSWRAAVAPYARPVTSRSVVQTVTTGSLFLGLMAALLVGLDHGIWAAAALVPVAALLLVRLFAIQHDCGHYSFFVSRRANDLLGGVIGVLTLTPYGLWRKAHAIHHATSGNLDRRGVGDISTLTVREYLARPFHARLAYRLYRHPIVLFGIGPGWQFLVRHRLPIRGTLGDASAWASSFIANAGIAGVLTGLWLLLGWQPLLLGWLPMMLLASSIGVWLFYVQHQFEDTYWERAATWDFDRAAIEGCSFYDLPRILHWLTGHLGFHHIHHLSSRIPNYRLRECFDAQPELREVRHLSFRESLRCPRLALWDEARRRLVSFTEARQR